MTNHLQEIQALAEKFTADVAKVVRRASKDVRHASHPSEPFAEMVKVYFTGDRDGNTFAVCHRTDEHKRVRRADGRMETARLWKYSYENATGTTNKRSWIGMLKTLDGHGRQVTHIKVYASGGVRTITL